MTINAHLKSLIIPGTTSDVIEQLSTLAQRAHAGGVALFEDDVIILDTETTGLDFQSCELIEIAATRMSGNRVVDSFHTFCKPTSPIPPEIEVLTGVTNQMVEDAITPQEAVEKLVTYVDGDTIVAHNAPFDRRFLEREAAGGMVTHAWIDSLEVARIALPRLTSYRLSDLTKAFDTTSSSHRATDDVEALCEIWRILMTALSDLPTSLLQRFSTWNPSVYWSLRPIFSQLAAASPLAQPFSLVSCREARIASAPKRTKRLDAADLAEILVPEKDEIDQVFSAGGLVNRMYAGYEPRDEQLIMAQEVREALQTSTHRAIEAGTGVGKSIAYLIPAARCAQQNNITLGIATKTNALTDQLVHHELPALAQALDTPLVYSSLKGYDHYPCLRKMERLVSGEDEMTEDMLTTLAKLYTFVAQSVEGDLDSVGIYWRQDARQAVTTTSSECAKRFCPYYPNLCFLHGARRRAESSDIVVTNHALLFRDQKSDGAILPPIRHWIVDEAHSVEAEARRQWAQECSLVELNAIYDALGTSRSGVLGNMAKRIETQDGATLVMSAINKAALAIPNASVVTQACFDAVKQLYYASGDSSTYDVAEVWLDERLRETPQWSEVFETGGALSNRLEILIDHTRDVFRLASEENPEITTELASLIQRLIEAREALDLVLYGEDTTYVFSAHVNKRANQRVESLRAERMDVGAELAASWYPEMMSVIYTSATIAVGESFAHFDHGVGFDLLDSDMHKGLRLDSSYNFAENMSVVVATDLPEPNQRGYLEALEELLFEVHVAMGGSVLTLFTNRREMEELYGRLVDRLAEEGLDLDCQLKGTSAKRLRDRFVSDENSSLFALRAFWEGFDAAGDTLRCVVIPKLPFSRPSDPLSREREKRESRAWAQYSLPDAVLSVKQAAGRLIRSSSDAGCLVLADTRLISKRYGKTFLGALPKQESVGLPTSEVGEYLQAWWRAARRD